MPRHAHVHKEIARSAGHIETRRICFQLFSRTAPFGPRRNFGKHSPWLVLQAWCRRRATNGFSGALLPARLLLSWPSPPKAPLRHPDHIRFRLRSRLGWGGAGAGHAFHADFGTASPPPPYNGSDCRAAAAPASAEFDSALRLPIFCA